MKALITSFAAVVAAAFVSFSQTSVCLPETVKPAQSANNAVVEEIKTETPENLVSLGTFKCYAYCGCRACNGKWTGYPTASGTDYVEGRTIAVDPDVIPLGTVLYINGDRYVAEDTGSGIVGKSIDVYHESHEEALRWGIKYLEVFVYG